LENALLFEKANSSRQRKAAEIYPFLETYIAKRELLILEIEQVIERYEKRRVKEEQAFQSMSNIRRIFSGKKPDHHLAVEYIHYVKKPKERIKQLREEIHTAKEIMIQSSTGQPITLPSSIAAELN
jgi:vacuolar-type H+-ATPase subunit D/Vma8